MTTSSRKTIVITASTAQERSMLIKRIYTNLHKEPSVQLTVVQDQINRIRIFHNVSPGMRVLIRTYLVVLIPVYIDLKPLNEIYGLVDFHLDETIKRLRTLTTKLESMQGQRFVKGDRGKDLESVLTDMIGGD